MMAGMSRLKRPVDIALVVAATLAAVVLSWTLADALTPPVAPDCALEVVEYPSGIRLYRACDPDDERALADLVNDAGR